MRLSAWDLTIERGGRRLFAGLSFAVDQGAALVVTGPNGAGKSSLLRALCGFLPLEAGGFALERGDAERTVGEQAHYLGHADGVKGALTAGENLAFAAAMLGGRSSREAQRDALARVGLAHVIDFPARLLSAGQRRRVALARLLIADRPLWLLDEPATALDAAAQAALAAIMQGRLRGGGIIVAAVPRAAGARRRARAEARRNRASCAMSSAPSPQPSPANGRGGRAASPPAGEGGPDKGVRKNARLSTGYGPDDRPRHRPFRPRVAHRPAHRRRRARRRGVLPHPGRGHAVRARARPDLLARLGPAILWIAALLATLLGLDRLFQADHEDGSLDILVNGLLPLEIAVLVKCAAHWTASALPLIVVSPLFGLMLAMTPLPLILVAATLAAGTPALTMIGAIGAALTVSLRRGGLLMAVLVLPLTIPVLIFGVAAASAASGGAAPFLTPFLMLCALSLFAIAAAPFAAAAALRHVRECDSALLPEIALFNPAPFRACGDFDERVVERLLERAAMRQGKSHIGWGEDALGRLDRSPRTARRSGIGASRRC